MSEIALRGPLSVSGTTVDASEAMVRCLDVGLAVTLLTVLSPAVAVRAATALLTAGRLRDEEEICGRGRQPLKVWRFAGDAPLSGLGLLFGVFRGHLAFVGPRPMSPAEAAHHHGLAWRWTVRPGLISPFAIRQRVGIAYETEFEVEKAHVRERSVRSTVGLLLRASLQRLFGSASPLPAPPTISLLDVDITNSGMEEAVDWLTERANCGISTDAAFVNPHCLNVAATNPAFARTLSIMDRVYADGIGLQIGCRMIGKRLKANVNGTDMLPQLCQAAADKGLSLYLLGARPGVADAVAANIRNRYPGLQIAGTHHGYFGGPDDEQPVIKAINESGADILLIALGVPMQEFWLIRNRDQLRPAVRLGVGGLFDFYSGRIPRAPQWMRELGLEWSWRLIQEPGRMWRRYLLGNPLFLFRILQQDFAERRARRAAGRVRRLSWKGGLRRRTWRWGWAATEGGKRALDVAAAGAGLALISPLLAVLAVLIKLEAPGPVFFRQTRIGRHGAPFTMWKLRSMYVDAEARKAELATEHKQPGGIRFKLARDPRVTRIGRIIRRASIDELPQLWNVLNGTMSLVGPRPPLPSEVAEYTLDHRDRLAVRPGITCIWQTAGRADIPFERQVEMDLQYIQTASLWLDLRLILKTIPAVLLARGAY